MNRPTCVAFAPTHRQDGDAAREPGGHHRPYPEEIGLDDPVEQQPDDGCGHKACRHIGQQRHAGIIKRNLDGLAQAGAEEVVVGLEGLDQPVDVVLDKFRGIAAPKGQPAEVIKAWETAIPKVLEKPAFKKWYESAGLVPTVMNHDEYNKFLAEFVEKQRAFFEKYGITKD